MLSGVLRTESERERERLREGGREEKVMLLNVMEWKVEAEQADNNLWQPKHNSHKFSSLNFLATGLDFQNKSPCPSSCQQSVHMHTVTETRAVSTCFIEMSSSPHVPCAIKI